MRRLWGLFLGLALAACAQQPDPAKPALWIVEGANGQTAWLFGTIHALPRPVEWRSPRIDDALARSDRIVVEVGNLSDDAAMAGIFDRLARSDGLPPLAARVSPPLRAKLSALLERGGMKPDQFDGIETWAAALMLARVGSEPEAGANGVDRAVMAASKGKPLVELEGAEAQLGLFHRLPEAEQRDLLGAVVGDPEGADGESARSADIWRKGDMAAIEAETRTGLLADPELREVLFTGRNTAWTNAIDAMLLRGERPFVAVGAAHMAGPEGLPAMLAAKGYKVTRLQ